MAPGSRIYSYIFPSLFFPESPRSIYFSTFASSLKHPVSSVQSLLHSKIQPTLPGRNTTPSLWQVPSRRVHGTEALPGGDQAGCRFLQVLSLGPHLPLCLCAPPARASGTHTGWWLLGADMTPSRGDRDPRGAAGAWAASLAVRVKGDFTCTRPWLYFDGWSKSHAGV